MSHLPLDIWSSKAFQVPQYTQLPEAEHQCLKKSYLQTRVVEYCEKITTGTICQKTQQTIVVLSTRWNILRGFTSLPEPQSLIVFSSPYMPKNIDKNFLVLLETWKNNSSRRTKLPDLIQLFVDVETSSPCNYLHDDYSQFNEAILIKYKLDTNYFLQKGWYKQDIREKCCHFEYHDLTEIWRHM